MNYRFGAVLFLAFIFAGCNYTKMKEAPVDATVQYDLPAEKLSELSYTLLAQKVFAPNCISCHGNSGGINLESYSEVKKNLSKIQKSVFENKTMPKRGTLSQEEMAYLWNWIQMGAPEVAQTGTPPPIVEPILATFESIDRHILQTSCKNCHNSSGTGKRIPLDKESLLNSPLELVLPRNADESGLVLAVERLDEKRMPPAKEGYSALSDDGKKAIRQWIQNGATD